jgi:hypothetical protein
MSRGGNPRGPANRGNEYIETRSLPTGGLEARSKTVLVTARRIVGYRTLRDLTETALSYLARRAVCNRFASGAMIIAEGMKYASPAVDRRATKQCGLK